MWVKETQDTEEEDKPLFDIFKYVPTKQNQFEPFYERIGSDWGKARNNAPKCPRSSTTRKEKAAALRTLFTRLGFRDLVSVTAPNYSMARSIDVRLKTPPQPEYPLSAPSSILDMPPDMPYRQWYEAKQSACERLKTLILCAYPDWDDRSDSQTDYFDYCFSID